ncbi:MAG: PEP-CTERM motif protein [Planctomycetes bacterium ADurb.Bin126]|nr:MAG: PEP-CTERM motif protein [Planctomycetes bacterium ADurb.Bin126]HOD79903.1 PEP-CTERM sorting domain-containing protein [Phycisphaerae bacterium]HQL73282.1 PEP-CTERM sorting domain-containing protein [Phycisphaerae bacterium]
MKTGRIHNRTGVLVLLGLVAALAPATAWSGQLGLTAADSFWLEDYRGIGSYTVAPLASTAPQNPAVPGFVNAWQNGTTVTSAWSVAATGLDHPVQEGEAGGAVSYSGYGGGIRRVRHDVDSSAISSGSGVFYLGGLLRLDSNGDLTGLNIAGFSRDQGLNDTDYFDPAAAKDTEGLQWGFEGDGSQINLVLRHRYDTDLSSTTQTLRMLTEPVLNNVAVGTTYQVVAKIQMNSVSGDPRGNDLVSVWVNPVDITTEAAAGAPTAQFVDFSLNTRSFFHELVFASQDLGNQVTYDEMRMGTAWSDVAVRDRAVASERFALSAGPLHGRGSGSGWSGPWSVSDGGANPSLFQVQNPGAPLAFTAAGVDVHGGTSALRMAGNGSTTARYAERALSEVQSGDVFASFLVRWDGAMDTGDLFDAMFYSGSTQVGRFGAKVNGSADQGDFFVALGSNTSFVNPTGGLDFDPQSDHLLVARLFKTAGSNAYNAIAFWLDPAYADYNAPTWTYSNSSLSLQTIDAFRMSVRDLDTGKFVWIDELMLGTSWDQVVTLRELPTDIPEPASLALLALASAGLGGYVRRRR